MDHGETRRVVLVPLGGMEVEEVEGLAGPLRGLLQAPVEVGLRVALPLRSFHPDRGQYEATSLAEAGLLGRPDGTGLALGVCDVDLFVPGLTFVFGVALPEEGAAVFSVLRLRENESQPPPDPDTVLRRALTEAVHEVGHLAGLPHCPDPACVMHFSNTLEDADRKGPRPCGTCAPRLAAPFPGGG